MSALLVGFDARAAGARSRAGTLAGRLGVRRGLVSRRRAGGVGAPPGRFLGLGGGVDLENGQKSSAFARPAAPTPTRHPLRRTIRRVGPPADRAGAQLLRDPLRVEAEPRTRAIAEPERAEPPGVLAHPLRRDAEATRDLRRGQQPLLLVRPALLREPSDDALRDEISERREVVRVEARAGQVTPPRPRA
jgi:hypothetical protein